MSDESSSSKQNPEAETQAEERLSLWAQSLAETPLVQMPRLHRYVIRLQEAHARQREISGEF